MEHATPFGLRLSARRSAPFSTSPGFARRLVSTLGPAALACQLFWACGSYPGALRETVSRQKLGLALRRNEQLYLADKPPAGPSVLTSGGVSRSVLKAA